MEFEGDAIIALCSKSYFARTDDPKHCKTSAKGVNKRQNELKWEMYERALKGEEVIVENTGQGGLRTYTQRKMGMTGKYEKGRLLPDGIHSRPWDTLI